MVMTPPAPEAERKRAEVAKRALDFAHRCRLVVAEGQISTSKEVLALYDGLPRSQLDSVLAAIGSDGILLSEDKALRHLSESWSGVKAVWLQAVLKHGAMQGRITPAQYTDAVGLLIDSGHHFTTIGAVEFLVELKRHHWMPIRRVQRYISLLTASQNDRESTLKVLVEFLLLARRETGGDARFVGILWQILNSFHMMWDDLAVLLLELERELKLSVGLVRTGTAEHSLLMRHLLVSGIIAQLRRYAAWRGAATDAP